jgi:hypothetical protein
MDADSLSGAGREGEVLLRNVGWQRCPEARAGDSSMPGNSCWCIDREDPYAPDAFVTPYGFVLELPHGELCPPSVLRFPRRPRERGYGRAFARLQAFVDASDLQVVHSDDP